MLRSWLNQKYECIVIYGFVKAFFGIRNVKNVRVEKALFQMGA